MDVLSSEGKDALHDIETTIDFIGGEWTPERYDTVPLMWVRSVTVESLEHAMFPLLQISLCLSSNELLCDFGCGLSDTVHNTVRRLSATAIYCRHTQCPRKRCSDVFRHCRSTWRPG
jgi:hypothetical protein